MIKIFACDKAFADCMKISVGYACQRCHVIYGPKHQGLHLSHYISRGNWSVRHHPDNGFVHCYGCHAHLGSRPAEFTSWVIDRSGFARHEILIELARDTARGRRARREKKEIAKFYRDQLFAFQGRRDKGEMGNFMVMAYD